LDDGESPFGRLGEPQGQRGRWRIELRVGGRRASHEARVRVEKQRRAE